MRRTEAQMLRLRRARRRPTRSATWSRRRPRSPASGTRAGPPNTTARSWPRRRLRRRQSERQSACAAAADRAAPLVPVVPAESQSNPAYLYPALFAYLQSHELYRVGNKLTALGRGPVWRTTFLALPRLLCNQGSEGTHERPRFGTRERGP